VTWKEEGDERALVAEGDPGFPGAAGRRGRGDLPEPPHADLDDSRLVRGAKVTDTGSAITVHVGGGPPPCPGAGGGGGQAEQAGNWGIVIRRMCMETPSLKG